MPLPHTAQNGAGVLVVPCPEAAFLTTIHCRISNFLGTVIRNQVVGPHNVQFLAALFPGAWDRNRTGTMLCTEGFSVPGPPPASRASQGFQTLRSKTGAVLHFSIAHRWCFCGQSLKTHLLRFCYIPCQGSRAWPSNLSFSWVNRVWKTIENVGNEDWF